MKPQPSLLILSAVAATGALLLGCEGGIKQLEPGTSGETVLTAAYVDPRTPTPAGLRANDGGDGDKLPLLDGDATDKEWNVADPLFVYVSGDRALGGTGYYVELRAIWSDEARFANPNTPNPLLKNYLYLLVRYADETFDIFPDYWRYARLGQLGLVPSPMPVAEGRDCDSVIVAGKNWFIESPNHEEDQVSFMFQIEPTSDDRGTFDELGCQVACHGGTFGPVPHGKLDVWTWRAALTNAQESTLYPDFTQLDNGDNADGKPKSVYPRLDPESNWPAYMEDMWADNGGLHDDAASASYPPAKNGYTGQLYIRNISFIHSSDERPIPNFITERVKGVKPGTGGTVEPTEPVNGGLPTKWFLWGPTAQLFDVCDSVATSRISAGDLWSQRLTPGETDVMPGYMIFIPNGSAADVRAKGDHVENQLKRFPTWTLEIRRPLVTGASSTVSNPDDATLDPTKEYTFTIAIFDRSAQIHSGSGPLKLRFSPSLHAPSGRAQGS